MRGLFLISLLLGVPALAGDVQVRVNLGAWQVGGGLHSRVFVPYGVHPYYWQWVPYTPPPPPPPQIIYIEREPVREVVVVQLPPVEPPAPVVAAPAPPPPPVALPLPAPVPLPSAAPLGPRVPGPDVFLWTDEDGVVHYSTRVPADARKRAKKLATPAK